MDRCTVDLRIRPAQIGFSQVLVDDISARDHFKVKDIFFGVGHIHGFRLYVAVGAAESVLADLPCLSE